jgi:flagellar biosynthesis anti-sigma factor FlgM
MRIPSKIYVNEQTRVAQRGDAAVRSQQGSESASRGVRPGGADDVRVSVSSRARQLAANQDIDTQRVAALKAQVADGSLSIDSARIADAMLGPE